MLTGIIVAETGVIAGNEIIARVECFVNVWLTRLLLLTMGIIEVIADNGGYCSRRMGVIVNEHYCCWQRELLLRMVIACNKYTTEFYDKKDGVRGGRGGRGGHEIPGVCEVRGGCEVRGDRLVERGRVIEST